MRIAHQLVKWSQEAMTSEPQEQAHHLKELGPGSGSKVEQIKVTSNYLRGQIAEELAQPTTHFSDAQIQLLKFHGMYQQEDRDARQARKAAKEEKAYQFMIRSRIPGGVLTAEQYLVQDDLAGVYGNETLRVTTRQGFQLHGVLKGDIQPTLKSINAALLSTLAACGDVNRNVMACPAPHASRLHAQIETIAHDIATRLAPRSTAYHEIWIDGEQVETVEAPQEEVVEPLYGPTYLPRKFKIGVAFPGDNCIDVYTQDLGLIAQLDGERLAGFTVLVGGGMGMTHGKTTTYPRLGTPLCFAPPEEALQIVETIVTIQRDFGDRQNRKHARLKYLLEEQGIAWFRAELEQRLGHPVADPGPISWQSSEDHLGWHEQGDGRWFLGLYIESGRIKDDEMVRLRSGLRQAIEQFKPGIHLTPQQNILLTDVPAEQREPLTALLAAYGIATDPAALGVHRYSLACPALPTCGLALADAERVLPSIVDQIQDDLNTLGLAEEPISIRMTGCPNGCARPFMGDLGFVGRSKNLYNVYIGGDQMNTRMNTLYAADVQFDDLAKTVQPLLHRWRDERLSGEAFGDFCHRVGVKALRECTTVASSGD
jgi:sulfite reductase (ferredoxin)